jgi:hypothetical protein
MGDFIACTLTLNDLKTLNYVGLNVMVCVNANPTLDPTCEQGQWITVINGACLDEAVTGSVALQDRGNRLLVRVGGASNLTSCLVSWELEIVRSQGGCFISDPGYGTCCTLQCKQGHRVTENCFCSCAPGFSGPECDRMLPFIEATYVFGNTSLADWLAFTPAEISPAQPRNILNLRNAVASLIGLESNHVEFVWARTPEAHARRAAATAAVAAAAAAADGCAAAVFGSRVTSVSVRIVVPFEYNLLPVRRRLAAARGNLTRALAALGSYVCLLDDSALGYTSYGARIDLSEPEMQDADGLGQSATLLFVFLALGGLLVLLFLALHCYTVRAEERDSTRHLRDHKPIAMMYKQGCPWRFEDPATRLLVAYPGDVSAALQDAFISGWVEAGRPTVGFAHAGAECEADFTRMQVTERPVEGVVQEVVDSCTLRLDRNASPVSQTHNGSILIIGGGRAQDSRCHPAPAPRPPPPRAAARAGSRAPRARRAVFARQCVPCAAVGPCRFLTSRGGGPPLRYQGRKESLRLPARRAGSVGG